jgi:cytochrome P450/NADPH-cytochrome P450 reductase
MTHQFKVLRETLRQSAPISSFAREALKDEIIGGKYKVEAGTQIALLLSASQSDTVVYGPTADQFVPERMLDENFERIQREFPHSWIPFGSGIRSCIGRPFAWQEMILGLAVLVQNFNFVMDNPSYTLHVAQTLTVKPKDFYVRAIPRDGLTPAQMEARLAGAYHGAGVASKPNRAKSSPAANEEAEVETGKKVAIYYGSNSGTCEFMAQRLASDSAVHGFQASINPLDAAKEDLPTDTPVIIITSSYEGQPPQNASHFVSWIGSLKDTELKDVSYAVWGCGTLQTRTCASLEAQS